MKKRIWTILTVGACLATLLFGGVSFSQEEVETVEDSAFTKIKRPPVPFMHDDHNERAGIEECGACHHVYDEHGLLNEDETSEDMECSECHHPEKKGSLELMKKYHLRCKKCHQQEKKGPVMCGECHVRP